MLSHNPEAMSRRKPSATSRHYAGTFILPTASHPEPLTTHSPADA